MQPHIETEVKIAITSKEEIQNKLSQLGAVCVGEVFEKTIRLDTANTDLKKQGIFLRVRSGFETVVTLKEDLPQSDVKRKQETEVIVGSLEKMRYIFNRLGYTKEVVMEKKRQNWELGSVTISLDAVFFGTYMEIEGEEADIYATMTALQIPKDSIITASYWELFEEYKAQHNVSGDNIVFNNG